MAKIWQTNQNQFGVHYLKQFFSCFENKRKDVEMIFQTNKYLKCLNYTLHCCVHMGRSFSTEMLQIPICMCSDVKTNFYSHLHLSIYFLTISIFENNFRFVEWTIYGM
jgi:hypothetical protein